MNLCLQWLLAVYLLVSLWQNSRLPHLGKVGLTPDSIQAITSPTWFNWLELTLGLFIAAGVFNLLRQAARSVPKGNFRLLLPSDSETVKNQVKAWYDISVELGFGVPGGAIGTSINLIRSGLECIVSYAKQLTVHQV